MDLTNFNAEQARSLMTHDEDCLLNSLLKLIYDEALRGASCCYTFDVISPRVYDDLTSRGFEVIYNNLSAADSSVYRHKITW